MSIRINITEETSNISEMIYCLKEIIKLIEKGYTSGYCPNFQLIGEEEEEEEEEE